MIDNQRAIERLRIVNEALHVAARLIESGAAAIESAEILDGVVLIQGEAMNKADCVYAGLRSLRAAGGCKTFSEATRRKEAAETDSG